MARKVRIRKSEPPAAGPPAEEEATAASQPRPRTRRRATAQTMAAGQRDISVSEFFAKNRHLLGFDSPRKALLTSVKEAVDNALDACEEAGILPEIWVRIEQVGETGARYRMSVQDNGPGIVSKQIPLIFGKLLYGSKFHRLRMSRGQQGIGISAAGMYGVLTTGKPVKIVSKTDAKKPAHYYELRIDTKTNQPQILNGRGEGVDIPAGKNGAELMKKHAIEWVAENDVGEPVQHGTRVTIEMEAKFQRGRGSVEEYLEQTAIANPHARIHFAGPDGNERLLERANDELPPEPKEIKPHPYGVELGRLVTMLQEHPRITLAQFLTQSFSRVSAGTARKLCEAAKLSTRATAGKLGRGEADAIYRAIQEIRIPPPATDCIVPIGEQRLLAGLRQVVPGEFFTAATRPPAVYRGNPFQIEAALAYGGGPSAKRISREALGELAGESDARSMRQFLITTFAGVGSDGADKILTEAKLTPRQSPAKLAKKQLDVLHEAMQHVNAEEGQSMTVLRFANRVPLQFQHAACAVTQTILSTNWRSYGLSQSRGSLPSGPVTVMVHMASVWVPFTSESKEAIAHYPEIQKEIRLALQAVGRKLGMYLRRRLRVAQEGQRRNIFLRYLGEVASAVSQINGTDRVDLYEQLLAVAKRKTAEADVKLDDRGRPIEEPDEIDLGENCIIVSQPPPADGGPSDQESASLDDGKASRSTSSRPRKKARRRRRG
ncbi:MAG: DNA topoisomerase VI subunit B [Planctomycetota bacterium]|jgi:DNA topoisomerase-6 subunit B|nr:DNA topoisomerase VI subunit B [Planctomycetota bacterium]MDA1200732.1 DNA topoisomerase VI subunit B [Planctomycetota bacterium]